MSDPVYFDPSRDRMGVLEFGRGLLCTLDLDPVYVVLAHAGLEEARLRRLLLAYWCFYHLGVASEISTHQGKEFWEQMRFGDLRWPRGRERRHWRGKQSKRSLDWLEENFPQPEDASLALELPTFTDVTLELKRWVGFGPWIAFKSADMLERLGLASISFDIDNLQFYSHPVEGAHMVVERYYMTGFSKEEALPAVVRWLLKSFNEWQAPPRFERQFGIQEAETVLCKWASHMKGHYPLGNDVAEVTHALHGWETGALLEVINEKWGDLQAQATPLIERQVQDEEC